MSKYRSTMVIMICLLFSLCSCKKTESQPIEAVVDCLTFYDTSFLNAYTVDEEGKVYTIEYFPREEISFEETMEYEEYLKRLEEYEAEQSKETFFLITYDQDGTLLSKKEYTPLFGLNSFIGAIAVKENVLYHSALRGNETGNGCPILYRYDIEKDEVEALCDFASYSSIRRILIGEDVLYLLAEKGQIEGADIKSDGRKRTVFQYVLSTGRLSSLSIKNPIDIALNSEGKLIVNQGIEEGSQLILYDPDRKAMKLLAPVTGMEIGCFALCGDDNGILFTPYAGDGVYYSSFQEFSKTCMVYNFGISSDHCINCNNGFVVCRAPMDTLVQFPIDKVKKENQIIKYITSENDILRPYTCGYQVERKTMTSEKLSLKLLALDSDFDICLMDSRFGQSDNLKKNGNFYSLNKVPGIKEYLDTCFPYVKVAATKKDGSIWMLPIAVDLPTLIYDTAMEEELTQPFSAGMTYDEFIEAVKAVPEESKTKLTIYGVEQDFLSNYLSTHSTLDTDYFRTSIRLFQENRTLLNYYNYEYHSSYEKGNYILSTMNSSVFLGEGYRRWIGDSARAIGLPHSKRKRRTTEPLHSLSSIQNRTILPQ